MSDAVTTWFLKLQIEDGEIVGVKCLNADGSVFADGDVFERDERKKLKKSFYGLRKANTLYEYNKKFETLGKDTDLGILAGNCYQIIGGFKVKVPCT